MYQTQLNCILGEMVKMINIMYRLLQQNIYKTFLVVQWIRIHLPMQGTQVQSLVWEDPTNLRATKPMHPNF